MFTGHEDASVEKKTSEEETKLSEDFGSLYLNKKLSDVTFLVGGERIHAHKTILGLRSEQFEALFNANFDKKEITISDTSPESFRFLLKYIYTGTIIIPSNHEMTLQVLKLARQYCPKQFVDNITKKITSILDEKNVVYFVNGANDNDLVKLRDACHLLIDAKAVRMLSSDSFKDLTQKALHQILKRDTFVAPQTEIIKGVISWCEKNNDAEQLLAQCTSLSLLSVSEIMSIVWPKLANSNKLLDAFFENVDNGLKESYLKVVDENIASVQHGAKVISYVDNIGLLNGNRNVDEFLHQKINDVNGIVIRLEKPYIINHIRMKLWGNQGDYYSYYIEVSLDQMKWHTIIDYTKYACRSVQNLYFPDQAAQYLKIVGTSPPGNTSFRLVFFEAFYRKKVPKTLNGVIRPESNVATSMNNAIILEDNCGDMDELIVQLPQPYCISSIHLLLENLYDNYCEYSVETSINKTNWEPVRVVKYTWRDVYFQEKIVVFIKINGIHRTSLRGWNCDHFIKCPSEREKMV